MKKYLVLGLVAAACSAHAIELFNNGSLVNSAGLSVLTAPNTTLGATSSIPSNFTLADNFAVGGAGWNVASFDLFAYQTGAVGFTFTSVNWSIVSGANVNTGAVVASGSTAVSNGGFVGYRVSSTALTGTTRAIYRINADIPDLSLAAGSCWLTWALAGAAVSGPFVPPVSAGAGNAQQSAVGPGGLAAVLDASSSATLGMPFAINGSAVVVPEPATGALFALGALAVFRAQRRRKV